MTLVGVTDVLLWRKRNCHVTNALRNYLILATSVIRKLFAVMHGAVINTGPRFPHKLTPMEMIAWWRHEMETFSALLTNCAENSPVPAGEFPVQRPVTRSFDVFCDLRLNKRLINGQLRGKCFHLMTSSWKRMQSETRCQCVKIILVRHLWAHSCHVRDKIMYVLLWQSRFLNCGLSLSDQTMHTTWLGTCDIIIKSFIYQVYLGKTLQCILFGHGYFYCQYTLPCCLYPWALYQKWTYFSNNYGSSLGVPLP